MAERTIYEGPYPSSRQLEPRVKNDARNNAHRLYVETPNTTVIVSASDFQAYWELPDTPAAGPYAVVHNGVRDAVEKYIRRYLLTTGLVLWYDKAPNQNWIELPKPPAQAASVVIKWYDEDDTETTFSSDNYRLAYQRARAKIVLADDVSWPSDNLRNIDAISFAYDCGFGDAATDIPGGLLLAFYRLLADFWERKADFCVTTTGVECALSNAQKMLLEPWRVTKT